MGSSGDGIKAKNANWKFKGDMVNSFEKHISKSIPLYKKGHKLILKLSDFFIKEGSTCYELGSSTGILSYKLAKRHKKREAKFIAIEIEKDMVKKAKKRYKRDNLSFIQKDINLFEFEKSDLIISYYTIQFIHPSLRQQLIDKIYNSLNWGGAFIMFEKVRANDARFQDIMTSLYLDYKLEKGYTPNEIIHKARSLKGILEPFSTKGDEDLLKRAGFVDIISVMKYITFEGFLAIK